MSVEVITKARQEAKRAFFAQCGVLITEIEGTKQMIRGRLNLLENHECTELDALTGILTDVQSLQVELNLPALIEKYIVFQQTEFALMRAEEES